MNFNDIIEKFEEYGLAEIYPVVNVFKVFASLFEILFKMFSSFFPAAE